MILNIWNMLLIAITVAIFLNGYYYGRHNHKRLFFTIIIIMLIDTFMVMLEGAWSFILYLNEGLYEYIVGIGYVIFWWVLGYIGSCFYLVRSRSNETGVIVKR